MSLADEIIDRQKIRRKLGFWRIVAIAAVGLVVLFAIMRAFDGTGSAGKSGDHIAHVSITGAISVNQDLLERLDEIADSDNAKALILTISSPGGTTAGGEALYDAVKRVAAKKPVVAQVDTLAASAGYMVATASQHIIARKTSIVGSIGVIFQYPKINGLLETVGIEVRSIKSSPLKAEPSFFGETPAGAEDMIKTMLLDTFAWFKDLVAEERGLSVAQINTLADGSVFTGRQALLNGLIDGLGGMEAAEKWVRDQDIDAAIPIIEWRPPAVRPGLLFSSLAQSWLAQRLGISLMSTKTNEFADRVLLDGLLSVWHVQ